MDIDSPPAPSYPDPHASHKHIILPSFSASFPLPFRVLFLIGLAQLLWAVNLHVLHAVGIDTSWVLDLREDDEDGVGLEGEGEGIELGETDTGSAAPGTTSRSLRRNRDIIDLSDDLEDYPPPAITSTSTSSSSLASAATIASRSRSRRRESSKLHKPVYKLFVLYTLWVGAGWALFHFLADGERERMEMLRGIPGVLALGVIGGVVVPWRGVGERERAGLRRALRRILLPPLNEPVFFSDVILADILTSFAKVLGDMWISGCQIWGGGITQGRVSQAGWSNWVTLGMVSLPYVLRFRQCLLEYYQSSWTSPRPLANALKYFSAFPVIFLSAAQKAVVSEIANAKGMTIQELGEKHDRWFGEHRLFRLWLLAVVVNSMYSFYWDVELDWGLALCEVDTWLGGRAQRKDSTGGGTGLLGSPGSVLRGGRRRDSPPPLTIANLWIRLLGIFARSSPNHNHQRSPCPTPGPFHPSSPESPSRQPLNSALSLTTTPKSIFAFGLRSTLLLPDPIVYHLFTLIDLILRFTWSLKLSSHLHTISEIESGVFMMEALELVRRWMWVFVRVEWEAVKMGEMAKFRVGGGGNGGGGVGTSMGSSGGAGGGGVSKVLWEGDEGDRS